MTMHEKLKSRLIAMQEKDLKKRETFLKQGSLYDGYAEEMEALHIEHAEELKKIIDEHGWPGKSLVGLEGLRAAAMIAQHSISKPELQRFFLTKIKQAVQDGEAGPVLAAGLEDRILFNEGKPCLYGMLFDWDDFGNLVANVDDEAAVDERRKNLGLSSLSEALQKHRQEIEEELGGPPKDIAEHKRLGQEWARRVGWR